MERPYLKKLNQFLRQVYFNAKKPYKITGTQTRESGGLSWCTQWNHKRTILGKEQMEGLKLTLLLEVLS